MIEAGDIVKVKSREEIDKIQSSYTVFTSEMEKYCGTIHKVRTAYGFGPVTLEDCYDEVWDGDRLYWLFAKDWLTVVSCPDRVTESEFEELFGD